MNDNTTSPIKFTPAKDSFYKSDRSSKPSGSPSGMKNFKNILSKKDAGEEKESDMQAVDEREDGEGHRLSDLPQGAKDDKTLLTLASLQSGKKEVPESLIADSKDVSQPVNFFAKDTEKVKSPKSFLEADSKVAKQENTQEIFDDLSVKEDKGKKGSSDNAFGSDEEGKTSRNTDFADLYKGKVPESQSGKVKDEGFSSEINKPEGVVPLKEDSQAFKDLEKQASNAQPLDKTENLKRPQEGNENVASLGKKSIVDSEKAVRSLSEGEIKDVSKETKPAKRNYISTSFGNQDSEASRINLFQIHSPIETIGNATDKAVQRAEPISPDLQSLIDKLADTITVAQKGTDTDTTVELKYPPVFEGSRLIVTSFENAKNEFNVRFENLTQAAQTLLQQHYRAELMTQLELKGYNVHIFTATTFGEAKPITMNVDQSGKDRGGQSREQGDSRRDREQGFKK